jgi:hypothetical protein
MKVPLEALKAADFVELPEEVEGTNCGNCEYVREDKGGGHSCGHEKIKGQPVTPRHCCAYWDAPGTKREFQERIEETMDPLNTVLQKIEEGTVTVADFNNLIEATHPGLPQVDEANAKSTIERVHRRTRLDKVEPRGHSMAGRVAPKHQGDNDPRQHRGKRNFRPGEQKKNNEEQKKRLAKESLDYLARNRGKAIVEDVQAIDPEVRWTIRATISKMFLDSAYRDAIQRHCLGESVESGFDDQWLYGLLAAIDQTNVTAVLSE